MAAFGAPLESFEVTEADFATYDGVLQIGAPPRRIDLMNRADGITFEEARAGGDFFELEGRRIPVIGLAALLKNKRAAARAQDVADVAALEGPPNRSAGAPKPPPRLSPVLPELARAAPDRE